MNYLLFGVFWSIIMDLANSGIGKQEVTAQFKFGNLARFLAIIAWPIFVTIFFVSFHRWVDQEYQGDVFPLNCIIICSIVMFGR